MATVLLWFVLALILALMLVSGWRAPHWAPGQNLKSNFRRFWRKRSEHSGRLFWSFYFRMNEPLADQEFFCIDNLIEAVGAKGAIQPVVPHFQQSPLAADSAAAETRIFGPFY